MSGNAAAGGAAPLALDLDACCELWELISGYSSLVCDQLIFHLQNSSRELSLAFLEIKVDMQGVHVEVCFGSLGLHKVNRDDELIFSHNLRRLDARQRSYGLGKIGIKHLIEPQQLAIHLITKRPQLIVVVLAEGTPGQEATLFGPRVVN